MTIDLFHYYLIKKSGLFDRSYYLINNPDVRKADVDPLLHFIKLGWKEGRNPSDNFNTKDYLAKNPDVKLARINPLLHYIKHGKKEGRDPGSSHQTEDDQQADVDFASISITNKFNDQELLRIKLFNIVPFYFDPNYQTSIDTNHHSFKVAIHIHLFHSSGISELFNKLDNIPFPFDLFISTSFKFDKNIVIKLIKTNYINQDDIRFEEIIGCVSDLAPMIICFGREFLEYEYIAHFHNQFYEVEHQENKLFEEDIETILGSRSKVKQVINLLRNDAKFVYPAPKELLNGVDNGWYEYYEPSNYLLEELLGENINRFSQVEFPSGSIFWAKISALKNFLLISQNSSDFINLETSLNHQVSEILKRLLLISSFDVLGRNYRIHSTNSYNHSWYYECKKDYSESIINKDIKVLSFYLPQFYAIPENDRWHGKGFTEWDKVRSANPLFYGHNQQRVPHDALGYYYLDSPQTLRKQADLMRQSGVYGQIFYHYWFNGKLLLEKPSQILLANQSIDVPFCFCWANENWTMKWDGNEDDVLLAQNYSIEDAENFINYILPFIADERYIKINGRPVIFIYRPSLIPDFNIYKSCWKRVCEDSGINEPFIVAILTRGASSPVEYGMDAGCERVLHDWTDGNVKPINQLLFNYWPIRENVLDYEDVADYYINQNLNTDFPYFRSIVPSWDNAPRYGSDAFIVHNSSPGKFQEWLTELIRDSKQRLPVNHQFVIINAWNEWAESAYLEPDKCFGYAYLNSIGRALSNIDFNQREYLDQIIPNNINLHIRVSDNLVNQLRVDKKARNKLLKCITNSTVFSLCKVSIIQEQIIQWLSTFHCEYQNFKLSNNECKPDFTLNIEDLCFFPENMIENLLKMSLRYDVGTTSPTHVNDEIFTHEQLLERWEIQKTSPYLTLIKNDSNYSVKCCVDAQIFITKPEPTQAILPKVTTIIRFCEKDNLELLKKALFSLIAQISCKVQPIITLNNLSEQKLLRLDSLLKNLPWDEDCIPIIKHYISDKKYDLRSLMLNDSLKHVETKYVAFLDYDDVLFHNAYQWLLGRLKLTKKKASFGKVYHLTYNLANHRMVQRSIEHNYGKTYQDFIYNNNTPIHGFMLNLEKINLDKINYYEDMKYMEDYYLTLQIFDQDNTDWEALEKEKFIADYIHYEDKPQTLGLLDSQKRESLLNSPEYKKCQTQIDELRNGLLP